MLKYVELTSLDCNNNQFNRFRKINKHRFILIRNKEKRFYKVLAIFDEKKIKIICSYIKKNLLRQFKVKYDLTLIIASKDI